MTPRHLEDVLARRYRDAAPATLALLQARCEVITAELLSVDSRLKSVQDVASLRRAGKLIQRSMDFVILVESLLQKPVSRASHNLLSICQAA